MPFACARREPRRARRAPARRGPARRRHAASALGLAALGLVAGCGGGVVIGFGGGDWFDDERPVVSLFASPESASRGDTVTLTADPDDDGEVVQVRFYRLDGVGSTEIGRRDGPPWTWSTTVPTDAGTSVGYWAQARDDRGQRGSSTTVEVLVVD